MSSTSPGGWRSAVLPLILSSLTGTLLSLLSGPALARGLSLEDRGTYQTVGLLYFLLPELLGLSLATSIAASGKTTRPKIGPVILLCVISWPIAVSLILMISQSTSLRDATVSASILMLFYPLTLLVQLLKGVLQRQEMFRVFAITRFIDVSGSSIALIALFLFGQMTLVNATIALVVPTALASAFAAASIRRRSKIALGFDETWVNTLSFGSRLHAGRLLFLAFTYAGQIYVALTFPSQSLAIFAVASAVAALGLIVPTALQQVATPLVTSGMQNAAEATGKRVVKSLQLTFGLGVVLLTAYCLVAPWGLPLVFGDDYEAAWVPGLILLLAGCFTGLSVVCEGVLAGTRNSLSIVLARALGLAVLALILVLFGSRGINFVALSTLGASVVATLTLLATVRNRFALRIQSYGPKSFLALYANEFRRATRRTRKSA